MVDCKPSSSFFFAFANGNESSNVAHRYFPSQSLLRSQMPLVCGRRAFVLLWSMSLSIQLIFVVFLFSDISGRTGLGGLRYFKRLTRLEAGIFGNRCGAAAGSINTLFANSLPPSLIRSRTYRIVSFRQRSYQNHTPSGQKRFWGRSMYSFFHRSPRQRPTPSVQTDSPTILPIKAT